MSEPDQNSFETIHVMIYCINDGTSNIGYRVFPDPIIARRGDHLVFHVHGTSAKVDLGGKFGSDIDGGKNPKRTLEKYTGKPGNPSESGHYILKETGGAKPKAEYIVELTNCGGYLDPLAAAKSRRRATNPSMIIED